MAGAGDVFWLKRKLLGLERLVPGLDHGGDLAGAVGSRKKGGLGNALRLD